MHSQATLKLINVRFRSVAQAYIQICSSGIAIANDNSAAGAPIHDNVLKLVNLAIQANALTIER